MGNLDFSSAEFNFNYTDSVTSISIPTVQKLLSNSQVPRGRFIAFCSPTIFLTSLVYDADSATYDNNQQMISGSVSMNTSGGKEFGKYSKINGHGQLRSGKDSSSLNLSTGRSDCFFGCFVYTYSLQKQNCANNVWCDTFCDWAPCQTLWATQAFHDCWTACYGHIQAFVDWFKVLKSLSKIQYKSK